jgi:phosphoglycerol transferase MdoB-like AlkP superfamily enzyme
MKQIISSFFRQLIFWILFFNFSRLIFILYHLRLIVLEGIGFREVTGIFYHSFKLDLATGCYFMVIPFILLLFRLLSAGNWVNRANRIYASVMIVLYSLSATGEMGIYSEWKTKLTYKVINYFTHPSEIFNSTGTSSFFILLLLFLAIAFCGIFAYIRLFFKPLTIRKPSWLPAIGFAVITPGLLFIGMRGGFQQIPINQSESFYSDHTILNVASVNNAFNLYVSIFENFRNLGKNPFIYMEREEAQRIVKNIYAVEKDTTINILSVQRPNIVLIILESWSADLIEELGGKPGITPEFNKLREQGILFTQLYSSGARSEQGMASIFGGFPAHPISCATIQPDKFVKLPSLPQVLEKNGYQTAFYFGGQLIYGNIKGYIMYNGFDRINEIYDFPETLPRGKLGIHDEFTLNYMINDAGSLKEPFFVSLFTLSTHSPWDQPFEKPLSWGDNEREYINAAFYTDHCLGDFFKQAVRMPWYERTLFILVADHSHNSYYNWHPHSREYHRIPMLFIGPALKPEFAGTAWAKTGNQHDLVTTLLTQLGIADNSFHWSKNLFNPYTREFAYFANENGSGWISPDGYFSFEIHLPYCYFFETTPQTMDKMVSEGKAYLQEVYREYLED